MLKLLDLQKGYEEIAEVSAEMQEIAPAIQEGIAETRRATGFDASRVTVEKLPGNVAGLYELSSGRIKADLQTMTSGNANLIVHVLAHEGGHKENKDNGDEVIIKDWRFEEILNELSTADRLDDNVLAYREHMHLVISVIKATGVTQKELINLFRQGKNAELNNLYDLAFAELEKVAA